MSTPCESVPVTPERILDCCRALLLHTADAQLGDLVAALELARDLTQIAYGLERAPALAALQGPLARERAATDQALREAAEALSFAFSMRVILELVVRVHGLLEAVARAARAAPSSLSLAG